MDLGHLLKLRLVVGRYGEMDGAKWWNTQGVLGKHGSVVYRRGFPRTDLFVRSRVIFAVAQSRCREVFDPPGSITLWNLPAEIEDEFSSHWEAWLDDTSTWTPFFEKLEELPKEDLLDILGRFNLLAETHRESMTKMKRSAEGRAVPIAGSHLLDNDLMSLLAAGFSLGEPASPAIPYLKLDSIRQ